MEVKELYCNEYLSKIREPLDDNKYIKWYIALCRKAAIRSKTRNKAIELLGYVETHHIVPKSFGMGGEKDSNNKVHFTLREHFVSHKLLVKSFNGTEYEKTCKMAIFFFTRKNKTKKEVLSSKDYEFVRRCRVNLTKGIPRSEETKNKIRKSAKGRTFSEDHRMKLSLSHKGKPSKVVWNDEARQRFGIMMLGQKHSDKTKESMSKSQKKRFIDREYKELLSVKSHKALKEKRESFFTVQATDPNRKVTFHHNAIYFCKSMDISDHTAIHHFLRKKDGVIVDRGRFKGWVFKKVNIPRESNV
jgi:hypothetical protein